MGQLSQGCQVGTLFTGGLQGFQESGRPRVPGSEVFQTCFVGQGTGHAAFTDSGRSGDDYIPQAADPLTASHGELKLLIQAARDTVIYASYAGGKAQFGGL